jgi:hypothetical protein
MAESATFALKAGVWFRRGRLLIVSPDSLGTACPLSGRNSTYRPVQISAAGSDHPTGDTASYLHSHSAAEDEVSRHRCRETDAPNNC